MVFLLRNHGTLCAWTPKRELLVMVCVRQSLNEQSKVSRDASRYSLAEEIYTCNEKTEEDLHAYMSTSENILAVQDFVHANLGACLVA